MAEPEGGSAFEILGRIEVDLNALRKSLQAAESEVKGHADRLKRTWADSAQPNVVGGRGGGAPPEMKDPTEGARRGAKNTGAEFSHLARISREVLAGPLAQLSPELGHIVGGMAAAARSARFYGAALGAVVVGAVLATEVLGKFLEAANNATAATLEASRAAEELDLARSTGGMKKSIEDLAKYNLQVQQLGGTIESNLWQKEIARFAFVTDFITGSTENTIKALVQQAQAQANIIIPLIELPKALAEAEKKAADIAAEVAKRNQSNAQTVDALASAYDDAEKAIRRKVNAEREDLRIKELQERIAGTNAVGQAQAAGATPAQVAELSRALNARLAHYAIERKSLDDQERNQVAGNTDAREKALAKQTADAESFTQKEIQRGVTRIENADKTAQAVADAEEQITAARRKQDGEVESTESLELRLGATRKNTLEPLKASLDAVTAKYESQRRALEANIGAGIDAIKNREALADLEKQYADDRLAAEEKVTQAVAQLRAKEFAERQAQIKAQLEAEDKSATHRLALGRITYTEEFSRQRGIMTDPRRSLDEQRAAEEKLFEEKKQYAEKYFKLYSDLGRSTWAEQLTFAEDVLSQTVEGSDKWFDAVQKVSDVYKQIHDQAKSIYAQEVSIAEQEARRMGRSTISVRDVGALVDRARRRDAFALGGGRVQAGELSAAVGRQSLWETVDREGLSPDQAFARMSQNPQQQLADTLARVSTAVESLSGVGKEHEGLSALNDNAKSAADALTVLRDAALVAAGAMGGPSGTLPSNGGRGTETVTPNESSALGREGVLSSRRFPNTLQTAQ